TCFVRLTANGAIDGNGFASVAAYTNISQSSVALAEQTDGRVVVSAIRPTDPLQIVFRYNSDLTPDTTFGTSGVTVVQFSQVAQGADRSAVTLLPNGKIVTHTVTRTLNNNVLAIRLNVNGTLDTTYDSDGVLLFASPSVNTVGATFVLPDGKLLAAIFGDETGPGLVRFLPNGAPDTSFGANGIRINPVLVPNGFRYELGQTSTCNFGVTFAVAILQGGERIVFSGSGSRPPIQFTDEFCGFQLLGNTALDGQFNIFFSSFSGSASGEARPSTARIASEGKLVIGGRCGAPGSETFCFQRYNALPANCYDVDGDGTQNPLVDGLIKVRAELGLRDSAVTNGVGIPATAPRKTWPELRDFMAYSCGMRGIL
ncbi:MAG: hypothetical protein ACRDAM_06535, partial [Casimicrobium sp.]